ncbi:MAG: VaFE repeat-containing surface-anchored protein [Lachnospiraceae bacterium]|nr:VaFE repeat-containing surface-anchored protein [Lachnospiraceae bacterium]
MKLNLTKRLSALALSLAMTATAVLTDFTPPVVAQAATSLSGTDLNSDLLDSAFSYLGYGYSNDFRTGNGSGTFDCSGLVYKVLINNGFAANSTTPSNTGDWITAIKNHSLALTYNSQTLEYVYCTSVADYATAVSEAKKGNTTYAGKVIVCAANEISTGGANYQSLMSAGAIVPGSVLIYPAQSYTVGGVTYESEAHAAIAVADITPSNLATRAGIANAMSVHGWTENSDTTKVLTSFYNRAKYLQQVYNNSSISSLISANTSATKMIGFQDTTDVFNSCMGYFTDDTIGGVTNTLKAAYPLSLSGYNYKVNVNSSNPVFTSKQNYFVILGNTSDTSPVQYTKGGTTYYGIGSTVWRIEATNTHEGVCLTNNAGAKGEALYTYALYFDDTVTQHYYTSAQLKKVSSADDTTAVSGAVYAYIKPSQQISSPYAALSIAQTAAAKTSIQDAVDYVYTTATSAGSSVYGFFVTGTDTVPLRAYDANGTNHLSSSATVIDVGTSSTSTNGFLVEIYTPSDYERDTIAYSLVLNPNSNTSSDFTTAVTATTLTVTPATTSSNDTKITAESNTSSTLTYMLAKDTPTTLYGGFAHLKTDDTGGELSSVSFGVYSDANCTTLLDTITTDENGLASYITSWTDGASTKTVYVKELGADAEGLIVIGSTTYVADSSVYTVVLKAQSSAPTAEALKASVTGETTSTYYTVTGGDGALVIINREKTSHSFVKDFGDNDTESWIQSIEVQLKRKSSATSEENVGSTVTVTANDNWTYTWPKLDKYTETTIPAEYTYWVEEVSVKVKDLDGNTITISGSDLDKYFSRNTVTANNTTTITNTIAYTAHTVNKTFTGDAESYVSEINVSLVMVEANGTETPLASWSLNTNNGWTCTWSGLRKYDESKNELAYYVTEDSAVVVNAVGDAIYVSNADMSKYFNMSTSNDGTQISSTTNLTNSLVTVTGTFGLYKYDSATNTALEGAVFTVYSDDGCTVSVGTIQTDSTGFGSFTVGTGSSPVYFADGISKTYYVRETTAPTGYVADDTVYRVDLTLAETAADAAVAVSTTAGAVAVTNGSFPYFSVGNTEQVGQLVITKYGEQISGYTPLVETDDFATYTNAVFDFSSVTMTGAVFTLTAKEDIVNASGTTVYTAGDTVATVTVTDDTGKVTIPNLTLGKYTLTETQAPEGQTLPEIASWDIEFTYAGQTVSVVTESQSVYDEVYDTTISVRKQDSTTGNYLSGAYYGLFTAEAITLDTLATTIPADTLLAVVATDASVATEFSINIPYGNYYVMELQAPLGYTISNEKIGVDFTKPDTTATHTTVNFATTPGDTPMTGKVTVAKTSLEGTVPSTASLAGAVYGLYAAEDIYTADGQTLAYSTGDLVAQNTTAYVGTDTTVAYAEFTDLYLGNYYIKEITPSAGFKLDTAQYAVSVTTTSANHVATNSVPAVNETTIDVTVPVTESIISSKFKKTDAVTGWEVAGATLEIHYATYDATSNTYSIGDIVTQDGDELSWISTTDEHIVLGLAEGFYYLVESTAPTQNGYVKAQDVLFEVSSDKDTDLVEMRDDHTQLRIYKYDYVTDETLDGCVLQLLASDGSVYAEWTTGDTANTSIYKDTATGISYLILEYIPVGTYTLHEVSCPSGYELADDITVEVTETSEIITAKMYDVRTPEGKTTAWGKDTANKAVSQTTETTTITDRVTYKYLILGRTYELTTTLMCRETGAALLGTDGNPITVTTTFEPTTKEEGYVDVDITFPTSLLQGEAKTLTVFEDCNNSYCVAEETQELILKEHKGKNIEKNVIVTK